MEFLVSLIVLAVLAAPVILLVRWRINSKRFTTLEGQVAMVSRNQVTPSQLAELSRRVYQLEGVIAGMKAANTVAAQETPPKAEPVPVPVAAPTPEAKPAPTPQAERVDARSTAVPPCDGCARAGQAVHRTATASCACSFVRDCASPAVRRRATVRRAGARAPKPKQRGVGSRGRRQLAQQAGHLRPGSRHRALSRLLLHADGARGALRHRPGS